MSPTSSVKEIRSLVQKQLQPAVPAKWLPQFRFGLQAFALRPFQSAGSNARQVVGNANTAASKMLRLLSNQGLAIHLATVFDSLNLVRRGSLVNVDHSDVHGLTALVGALQTHHGRAIPCFNETTYGLRIPGAGSAKDRPWWRSLRAAMTTARRAQSFTGHTIDALQDFHDRLGFWPRLVFDRGFGNESTVTHLAAEGATFYIRLKCGRYVELDGQRTKVADLPRRDDAVNLFGLRLRVVRSPKNRRVSEPWYILTNDMVSSRTKVARIYYHRFEIEEVFKDMKHLFELHQARFTKPGSLKMVLWFVTLGVALLAVVSGMLARPRRPIHPKKRCSWLRQAYEQLQVAFGHLTGGVLGGVG